MNSRTARLLPLIRSGAVVLALPLSIFIGFTAQASSPNYQRLFLSILPFAIVDAGLVIFIIASRQKGRIWLAAVPAILAFVSYAEMACRVLLGIRLL